MKKLFIDSSLATSVINLQNTLYGDSCLDLDRVIQDVLWNWLHHDCVSNVGFNLSEGLCVELEKLNV